MIEQIKKMEDDEKRRHDKKYNIYMIQVFLKQIKRGDEIRSIGYLYVMMGDSFFINIYKSELYDFDEDRNEGISTT